MFHQRIIHIQEEKGSVYVTLLVPQSRLDYIILEIATLKEEFVSLIGIFELTIDQAILKEEKNYYHLYCHHFHLLLIIQIS